MAKESAPANYESNILLTSIMIAIEDTPKIQAKHLKENLGARGLPPSGAKGMSTQHLRKECMQKILENKCAEDDDKEAIELASEIKIAVMFF